MLKKTVRALNRAARYTTLATWSALIDTIYEELLVSHFKEKEEYDGDGDGELRRGRRNCVNWSKINEFMILLPSLWTINPKWLERPRERI